MAEETLQNGSALAKLHALISAQGGDARYVDDLELLPKAHNIESVKANKSGYIKAINAQNVGEACVILGGGRSKKGDPIDPAVGVMVNAKIGDKVVMGQSIFDVHFNKPEVIQDAIDKLKDAIDIVDEPVNPPPHSLGVIGL